ncbi:TetR/AcrR family transcriptional regulator [Aeromicrobium sp. 9AM]|uniref:TetR/AcrR family transcriptional regulator n=1 Tax=Aeromicrobium sp. 9AM TaxID=2653126 RepID=UPI0012F0C0CD|nr:TetR/AcrR family transcriptional regulator [Aeromicrobium sp. 9AM]VXB11056.1 TetR family transcriptional regulator [Aeromicrobium sp. 9AM]
MEQRSERHLATREEILAMAWSLSEDKGLAGWSLRELAAGVGMRAPSLYVYFRAKDQIYDAMFGESYRQLLERSVATPLPDEPRSRLHAMASMFFDFAVENPARLQLMFWRVIPGFEPSAEAYAPSLQALTLGQEALAGIGIADQAAMDMWTAVLTGLVTQQASNDPGGERWRRLLDEAVDMFAAAYL